MTMFSAKPDFDLAAFLAEPAPMKGSRRKSYATPAKSAQAKAKKEKAATAKAKSDTKA